MASFVFNNFKKALAEGSIDWVNDTFLLLLLDNTNTADPDNEFITSITTLGELSGTGYARKTLAGKTVTADLTNDRAEMDLTDVTFTAINAGTAAAALVVKDGASDAQRLCALFIDTGGFPVVTNGGDFTIQWDPEGGWQLV